MIDAQKAYDIFCQHVKEPIAEHICEFNNFYLINNCVTGDFVDDRYIIDKKNGHISKLDFIDFMAIKEDHIAIYEIKNMKVLL